MVGHGVIRDVAILCEFADGVATMQQHLHDAQPDGMRERLQALGGIGERGYITLGLGSVSVAANAIAWRLSPAASLIGRSGYLFLSGHKRQYIKTS